MGTGNLRPTVVGAALAGLVVTAGCTSIISGPDPTAAERTGPPAWSTHASSPPASPTQASPSPASSSPASSSPASETSTTAANSRTADASAQAAPAQAGASGREDCGSVAGPLDKPLWTEGGLSCADGASLLETFLASPGVRAGDKGAEIDGFNCGIMGAGEAQEYGYVIRCVASDGRGVFQ